MIGPARGKPTLRLVIPPNLDNHALLGSSADRAARNSLQSRSLAARLHAWLATSAEIRVAPSGVPQGTLVIRDEAGDVARRPIL
jgi:hypothetical protein